MSVRPALASFTGYENVDMCRFNQHLLSNQSALAVPALVTEADVHQEDLPPPPPAHQVIELPPRQDVGVMTEVVMGGAVAQ